MLTAVFQNHLVLQSLSNLPDAMSDAYSCPRDFESGRWGDKLGELSLEKPNASLTTRVILKLCLRQTHCVLRNGKAQNPTLFGKRVVKKQSSKGQPSRRKLVPKPSRKAPGKQLSLPRSHSRKRCRLRWSTSTQTFSSSWMPSPNAGGPDRRERPLARR